MWIRLHAGAERGHAVPTDREEFLAFAARAMRNILIEWARRRKAIKRGGDRTRSPLDERRLDGTGNDLGDGWARALLDLDDELESLRSQDSVCAEAFTLRFYGGLSDAQIGGHLGLTARQAGQLVRAARAALRCRIFHDESKTTAERRSDPNP